MTKTVALIGTLDTKGPEIAYLRDRCQALGLGTVVVDSGILGKPLGIEPDIDRAAVARAAGSSLEDIQQAGSRGAAVHRMMDGVRNTILNLYASDRLHAAACLGGAEGAVLGAHAMQALPIGVPKLLATPIASGSRQFGPLMGLRDIIIVHSIVDILGLNPVSMTIFDNMAAALKGMLEHGHAIHLKSGRRYVAITMLGNTTRAVMAAKERLTTAGFEAIIFHANGVGGPAMEELAKQGLFLGVIDFTTNELAGELVGGFHRVGPERLRTVGHLGLPQVIVPGCIDFSVHGPPETIPEDLRDRPIYIHNPFFTLVRTVKTEMRELGKRFAERLNDARGLVKIAVPTKGLSIPNREPDGVFWDPEADQAFLDALRSELRAGISIYEFSQHVNDAEFGMQVAELFIKLVSSTVDSESTASN